MGGFCKQQAQRPRFVAQGGVLPVGEDCGCASGPADLHVGPGDDVQVQSFMFCESSHQITYLGANSVFVDWEHETWTQF